MSDTRGQDVIRRTVPAILRAGTVVLLLGMLSGCSRFQAPATRLDYDVYNPEGSVSSRGQYVIGVRDEIEVLVWRCPELDQTVVVRPEDGMVTIPLIGDVKAAGLTPKELAEKISNRLAYYVKEPRVAVGVKQFGSKKVFIMGQVLANGTYKLERGDRMIDLITRAGGFTDNAVPSTTYIVRGGYEEHEVIRVNLGRLLHKGDMTQNVYLEEGDIVYVPMSELENLNYALRKVFPSMFFAEKLADLKRDIMGGAFDWHEVWLKMAGKK
jgi:polysaccharide export outer membrane protein